MLTSRKKHFQQLKKGLKPDDVIDELLALRDGRADSPEAVAKKLEEIINSRLENPKAVNIELSRVIRNFIRRLVFDLMGDESLIVPPSFDFVDQEITISLRNKYKQYEINDALGAIIQNSMNSMECRGINRDSVSLIGVGGESAKELKSKLQTKGIEIDKGAERFFDLVEVTATANEMAFVELPVSDFGALDGMFVGQIYDRAVLQFGLNLCSYESAINYCYHHSDDNIIGIKWIAMKPIISQEGPRTLVIARRDDGRLWLNAVAGRIDSKDTVIFCLQKIRI